MFDVTEEQREELRNIITSDNLTDEGAAEKTFEKLQEIDDSEGILDPIETLEFLVEEFEDELREHREHDDKISIIDIIKG